MNDSSSLTQELRAEGDIVPRIVDAPTSASEDPMPSREVASGQKGIGLAGALVGVLSRLPQPAFEAIVRRTQAPSKPSRRLVAPARVLRERVGGAGDDALGVPVTWIDKPRSTLGTVVHLHGGAYAIGEAPGHWTWFEELTRRADMSGAMVHYRMPPSAPFPTALDDAVGAIRALVASADLSENRWVLSGDSAGGGLALAAVQRLRDEGGPLPAGILLLSPWTDLTLSDPLVDTQASTDRLLTADALARAARDYAGAFALDDPRISPRFGSVEGLPPVLLVAGSDELLLGDARALRTALVDAEVPVAYVEQPGGQHDYTIVTTGPATQWALRRQIAFVRRASSLDL